MNYIYSEETIGSYKTPTESCSGVLIIKRIEKNTGNTSWIPVQEDNADYQQYLKDTKKN